MAKLILKRKGGIVAEYDLTHLPPILTIGSDPFDIIFIYDEKIFKKHLQLERIDNHYFIENLYSSQGGVFIKDQYLDKRLEIHDKDEVSLGEHTLIFSGIEKAKIVTSDDRFVFPDRVTEKTLEDKPLGISDEDRQISVEDVAGTGDETVIYSDKDLASFETPDEMATIKISEIPPPAYDLLVIKGPYSGNSYRLKPDVTKIGRDPNNNDIVVRETKKGEIDYTISRRHATITVKNGFYFLSDNNSKNGTYLNDEKLNENDERLLNNGDEINIVGQEASTIFRFVPAGEHDFTPPQKVTIIPEQPTQSIMAKGLSIVLVIVGVILFVISYLQRSLILDQPEPLEISHKQLNANEVFGNIQTKIPKISNLYQYQSTPALIKINKDGSVALVLIDPVGRLTLWDLNKNQLVWKTVIEGQPGFDYSITTADLNRDGSSEILLAGRDGRIHAFDAIYGNPRWSSDFLRGKFSGQPSIGDFNGDGFKDIVVCYEEGMIQCGIASAQGLVWKSFKFDYKTKAIPVIADIEADGADEILIGTELGVVLVLALKDNEIQLKKVYDIKFASNAFIGNSINNAMAVGRLPTARREPVLMITTRQYGVIAIDPTNFEPLWSDKLTDPYRPMPLYHCSPLLGDVNADGSLDAVVASHNGEIVLYADAGNSDVNIRQRKVWTFKSHPGTAFVATPALADLNKDGKLDIVAADTTGVLYLINGLNGKNLHEPIKSNSSFSASPLVADVNGDRHLEIIVLDNAYNIHLFQTNTKVKRNTIIWDQYAGTASHSSLFLFQPANIFIYNLMFYMSVLLILAVLGYWIFVFSRQLRSEL